MNKPRACPFCGSDGKPKPWHGGSPGFKYTVECSNEYCHAAPQTFGPTKEKAIERWNMRSGR